MPVDFCRHLVAYRITGIDVERFVNPWIPLVDLGNLPSSHQARVNHISVYERAVVVGKNSPRKSFVSLFTQHVYRVGQKH